MQDWTPRTSSKPKLWAFHVPVPVRLKTPAWQVHARAAAALSTERPLRQVENMAQARVRIASGFFKLFVTRELTVLPSSITSPTGLLP